MERSEIERALKAAGLEGVDAGFDYEVSGTEPVLASPHYLATGAATARLLTGLAAAELWRLRSGRRQAVRVDARHAAASLRSYMYARPVGQPPVAPDAGARSRGILPVTRIVAARDGRHVQLHGSFHDTAQILAELGLDDSADAAQIDAAVAARDAFELENAFIARRICGGVVRSRQEWEEHPQGRAIADLPLVSITRIGEAPPEALPDGDRPTSGVRVLDLTRVLAGPTCAKTIAEHGADVLHVSAPHLEQGGPFEMETGIGKRQAVLDLNRADHADTLRELARTADVFSQGYRLGTLARRGLGPDELARLRPGIVYVTENCYGPVGPWAERPGWEQLAQAATGMSHREGLESPEGTPRLAPAAVNDYTTGFLAAYGAMAALARRATEGGSWLVQVSLSQTSMWYQRLGEDNDPARADLGDTDGFTATMDTGDFGPITYLRPALSMSETEPRWDLPPARQGAHRPEWLAR
ncbi:MAG TPA: CoA transferase [Acidimicrobiales bacterium]|nr:CoA transferase [Acidimicrobiales bacterium]